MDPEDKSIILLNVHSNAMTPDDIQLYLQVSSRKQLTQRFTTGQYEENDRLWCAQQ